MEEFDRLRISVIGAGNGGQAYAGVLGLHNNDVTLYDRDNAKITSLKALGGIRIQGCLNGFGKVKCFTSDMAVAVQRADIILITTVANAHLHIAMAMAPYLKDGQTIVLNPGRTCGALEFQQALSSNHCKAKIHIGETQTLVYACRTIKTGVVNIIGIKDEVLLAALPASDTDIILNQMNKQFDCFTKADNVLQTGLENIGAMFHPCVLLFNAATIERNEDFWFYRDMTEQVAAFIEKFDAERLAVGKAYGIALLSVREWIKFAYKGTVGDTLCERMRNNPAYHDIKSPSTIFTRQLTEDIPTGVLPIMELGKAAGIETPLLHSMVQICEALLNMDLHTSGRTLKNLGLDGKDKEEILQYISHTR